MSNEELVFPAVLVLVPIVLQMAMIFIRRRLSQNSMLLKESPQLQTLVERIESRLKWSWLFAIVGLLWLGQNLLLASNSVPASESSIHRSPIVTP